MMVISVENVSTYMWHNLDGGQAPSNELALEEQFKV